MIDTINTITLELEIRELNITIGIHSGPVGRGWQSPPPCHAQICDCDRAAARPSSHARPRQAAADSAAASQGWRAEVARGDADRAEWFGACGCARGESGVAALARPVGRSGCGQREHERASWVACCS